MVFEWRTGWWLTSVLINTPGSSTMCSDGGADVLLTGGTYRCGHSCWLTKGEFLWITLAFAALCAYGAARVLAGGAREHAPFLASLAVIACCSGCSMALSPLFEPAVAGYDCDRWIWLTTAASVGQLRTTCPGTSSTGSARAAGRGACARRAARSASCASR